MMMQIINFLNLFDMEIVNGIFFYDLYIYLTEFYDKRI